MPRDAQSVQESPLTHLREPHRTARFGLRIRRPQVRVLPSALLKVAGLQVKCSSITRFVRLFTCPILQLVPQRGMEGTLRENSPDTIGSPKELGSTRNDLYPHQTIALAAQRGKAAWVHHRCFLLTLGGE